MAALVAPLDIAAWSGAEPPICSWANCLQE
jgi:hypothetical protein